MGRIRTSHNAAAPARFPRMRNVRCSRWTYPAALTLVLVTLAGCTAPAGKAGGDAASVVAAMVTPDGQGRPSSDMVTAFVQHAGQESGGRVRVVPRWPESDAVSDQDVAELVMNGTAQLGVVPARAWDLEGVQTLESLQVPGLVVSEAAAAAVAKDTVSSELMSGLSDAGVLGLALIPESVRRIFVFAPGTPRTFTWTGSVIRSLRSHMTTRVFEELGAQVREADGGAFAIAVQDGSITAAESSFALAEGTLPYPAGAIADLPLFAKFHTLVANRRWFDSLTTSDQAAVQQAARETLSDALDEFPAELRAAEAYCAAGGTVGHADPEAAARLAEVGRRVAAQLSSDPAQAHLVDRIRALAASVPADVPIPTCSPPEPRSPSTTPAGRTAPAASAGFPEGVYRMSVTVEELQGGMSVEEAHNHAGVWTLTFAGGDLSMGDGCTGTYTVARGRVELHLGSQPACGSAANGVLFTARWTLDGTTLRFLDVRSSQADTPDTFLQTLFQGRNFERIG